MIATNRPAALSLDANANGIRMSVDEFDSIEEYDCQYRYELVNGVVVVSPAPSIGERSPNDELGYLLRRYREDHAQGKIVDDTAFEQYVRVQNGRRRADRAIWIGLGRTPDEEADVPAIVVEFVSERLRDWRRDHINKRLEYAAAGVAEYWVIDRFRRNMTVYRGDSEERVINSGETYATDLLPGFELPLDRLLSVSDHYTA